MSVSVSNDDEMSITLDDYMSISHDDETSFHYDDTSSHDDETSSHYDDTSSHDDDTSSHYDDTSSHDDETSSHDDDTSSHDDETSVDEIVSYDDETIVDEIVSYDDETFVDIADTTMTASFRIDNTFIEPIIVHERSMVDADPSDSILEDSPLTFEIVKGASQRGKDLLLDSFGYTYNFKNFRGKTMRVQQQYAIEMMCT